MSTKIVLSAYEAAALAAARRAGENRKYLWNTIRTAYGIPATVKLAMDTTRVLYAKGTDPRQWLWHTDGTYVGCGVDAPMPTPRVTMHEPTKPRFVSQGEYDAPVWVRVDRDDLVSLLTESGYEVEALPAGFPAHADGLVYDAIEGAMYFKV